MKKTLWVLSLVFCVLFVASPAYCSTYYVDYANGNDSNTGDITHPYKTIYPKAYGMVVAGDTIYVRGGTHIYSATIAISKSGSAGAKYNLFAYPGERPILDFSSMSESSSNRGIQVHANYWYIKGLDIYKAGDNGMMLESPGSYNRIELCNFYENRDSGLQLANGAHDNDIINCDSYYNRDINQGNADGFSPKLTVGTGNYFYGCRSWQNSDDAYDCYLTTANEVNTTFENCWAFKAGFLKDGTQGTGNGNGFKMGSSTNNHNVTLKNCLAFQNKAKGFDQNHNKGSMKLYNCTAYNNGGYNYSITDTLAANKDANLTNCVHYTGSNNLGTFVVLTKVSWKPPFIVESNDFVSIDPAAAYGPRKADGNLPDINFMHLAAGSDLIDGGTIDGNVTYPYCGSKPDLGCFENCSSNPPGQASNPVPSTGVTDVSLTQDISWTAGSGATSRDVYFGTVNPPVTKVITNGTVLTYDTGTMTASTTYYWRVDEKNTNGTTTGTVWSFTTVPPPPGAATNPNPANAAINVILTSTLSWTADSGATSHDVYFGTAATPSFIGNQAGTTYSPGTMTPGTTYYWRIDEKNAGGTTTGTIWNFTTVPPVPGSATNPNPGNLSANVSLTAVLSWTAGSGAASHDVYFGTTATPSFIGNQTGTTYNPGTLASSTTYYWRIDEKNAGGTVQGTLWSFTTEDTQPPTPDPMAWLVEPNAISRTSITMTAATASDFSGVEYYFANITEPTHDSNWQDSNVYTDTNLVQGATYSYQVVARDKSANHNETGWSDPASATTLSYVCTSLILGDLDGNCEVDLFDYALLANAWANELPAADLNSDSFIDFNDIAQFASDWLTCNRDPDTECWK